MEPRLARRLRGVEAIPTGVVREPASRGIRAANSLLVMPCQPSVRDFDWADYPATARLWQATGRDALAEVELRATLKHGPGLMLVATADDDNIVGVVLGTFDGRRGWIHRLAVHQQHRRAGLASALVSELERRLTTLGALRINLLVMPDNAQGLAFWQRLGYVARPDVLCTKPTPGRTAWNP